MVGGRYRGEVGKVESEGGAWKRSLENGFFD